MCLHSLQKLQAIRKFLKTIFTSGSGNGHLSIKPWDGCVKTIQYCFHEKDCDVISQKGYTDKFITAQRENALTYEMNKQSYSKSLSDTILKIISETDLKYYNGNTNKHKYITYLIWDTCKQESVRFPNKYLIQSIIEYVQCKLTDNTEVLQTYEDLKNQWYSTMFTNELY